MYELEVGEVMVNTVARRETSCTKKFFLSPFLMWLGIYFGTGLFFSAMLRLALAYQMQLRVICAQHSKRVRYDTNNWVVGTKATPFKMSQCFLKKLK